MFCYRLAHIFCFCTKHKGSTFKPTATNGARAEVLYQHHKCNVYDWLYDFVIFCLHFLSYLIFEYLIVKYRWFFFSCKNFVQLDTLNCVSSRFKQDTLVISRNGSVITNKVLCNVCGSVPKKVHRVCSVISRSETLGIASPGRGCLWLCSVWINSRFKTCWPWGTI